MSQSQKSPAKSTVSQAASTSSYLDARANPTMSPRASIAIQQAFNDLGRVANNCLVVLRQLRKDMKKTHELMFETIANKKKIENKEKAYKELEDFNIKVLCMQIYLHIQSTRLPEKHPQLEMVDNMVEIYGMEHLNPVTSMIESMIDGNNWNEGQWQYFHYESELLRRHLTQGNSTLRRRKLIDIKLSDPENSNHRVYQVSLSGLQREITKRNLGIYPKLIRRTFSSTVVEFRFGVAIAKEKKEESKEPKEAKEGTEEKDKEKEPEKEKEQEDASEIAVLFKFVFVEKNGHVEYINMYAPMEDWVYDDDFVSKTICPYVPSRYSTYRGLTRQANHFLYRYFAVQKNWTAWSLLQFVSMFGRFRDVFDAKCTKCNKHLKNFLPPMVFELRSPHIAFHEACR
ncbi:unnamed protein product [Caenorhabditis angaria]|uniref:Mediator of RNA polymerase II transcription subunit 27 n=1 Tax=Caenorhabditis angaria TaxID=860376 RepID=A0A9P1J5B3_9PELO|nr:unnamed protein product [Caenorhabditis angaria]